MSNASAERQMNLHVTDTAVWPVDIAFVRLVMKAFRDFL